MLRGIIQISSGSPKHYIKTYSNRKYSNINIIHDLLDETIFTRIKYRLFEMMCSAYARCRLYPSLSMKLKTPSD